ncbi:hypothetical protein IAP91_16785 [Leuconostoc mesenteroides]|nr:hypothetical protein [Leuconostoc mesenteroides]
MSKIVKTILISTLLLTTVLVINLFKTQDAIRVQNIERTENSYNFYIKESNGISLDSETNFFKKLSHDDHVTIFKTDKINSNVLVKSVVYDYNSFPYLQFGLKKSKLFENTHKVYTNNNIPTFFSNTKLKLQTLDQTYSDKSMSVIGQYTVVSNSSNKNRTLTKISSFFNVNKKDIQEAPVTIKTGFINYTVIITSSIIIGVLIILFFINLIAPLNNLTTIGIKKLNGWSNIDIFVQTTLSNSLLILIVSFIIDSIVFISVTYHPNLFIISLIGSQFLIFVVYLLSNCMTYVVIQKITIKSLLKNFINLKVGVFVTYLLKSMIMISTIAILMLIGANFKALITNYQIDKDWKVYHNILTLDYVTASGTAGQELTNSSSQTEKKFVNIFNYLEKNVNAQYISTEKIVPSKNYFLSQKKYDTIYSESDYYNIAHVNDNYLKTTSLVSYIPETNGQNRTFLVPYKYKNSKQKIIKLAQNSVLEGTSFEIQQKLNADQIPVNILYYKNDISIFPYNTSIKEKIKDPIFSVINQKNMSWVEKQMLSNSGVDNSPIKIKNSKYNLKEIQKAIDQQTDENRIMPKFSSIGSLLGNQIDSNKSILKVLGLILFALLGLNVFGSYFLTATIIQSKKQILAIQKLHGYKLKDRFSNEIIVFCSIYLIQIIVLSIFSKSLIVIPIVIFILLIDILMTFIFILKFENKNLNNTLRGE